MAEQGTDNSIKIQPESTGPAVDVVQLTINGDLVERQRVETLPGPGLNTYGEDLAVVAGTTVTLVSYVAPADWQFFGIIAGGEADGEFIVSFGASIAYKSRTNIARREADFQLVAPDPAAGGTTVTVKVKNTAPSGTNIFEATLLGQRGERTA